jgi:uncharacterized membrane protein (DUF2068 family)
MNEKLAGLRSIAIFEGSKGVVALMLAFGIHMLSGAEIQLAIEWFVTHLHLNPNGHFLSAIIAGAGEVKHSTLTYIVLGTAAYALIRFIEAYGLWHAKKWTEWFALISGALYIPFEIREVYIDVNIVSVSILLINMLIVWYVYTLLFRSHKREKVNT